MRDYLLTVVIATLCAGFLQLATPPAPPPGAHPPAREDGPMPPPRGEEARRPTVH